MPLTADITLQITGEHTSALDLGTAKFPFAAALKHSLVNGTGAGAADRVFTDTRTLAASANENLDLAASLTDAYGQTITFATIKAVIVLADAGNTNDVNVTRPASNGVPLFLAASDGIPVKPGYGFAWFGAGTGIAVTASTGDLLNIANSSSGSSVTYKVIIIGTSA